MARQVLRGLRFATEMLVLSLVAGLLRFLPLEASVRFSGWCWQLVAPRLKRHARAQRHLAAALPELDPAAQKQILLAMWRNLGMTFAEALVLDRIIAEPERIQCSAQTLEAIERAKANRTVFVSLHMGNWEIATAPLALAGVRIAGLYQRVQNPRVEDMLVKLREPLYPAGLFPKSNDAVKRIMRHVRENGSVAVLADLRDLRGLHVPFMGRAAPSTPFPAMVARLNGCDLVVARILRTGPARFRCDVETITVPETNNRQDDILSATAAIQASLEHFIRADPEQWMWAHRRYER
jgi:Kdo2-lipid IVA lauroyltransferase/acyltransferase